MKLFFLAKVRRYILTFHVVAAGNQTVEKKIIDLREKEGDLTRSYDKIPYPNRKLKKIDNTKTPINTSITQQFWIDLGR